MALSSLKQLTSSLYYDPKQTFFSSGKTAAKSVAEWKKFYSSKTRKYYGSRAQAEKAEALHDEKTAERWEKLKKLPAFISWYTVPASIRKEASGGNSWDPWTAFFIEYGWDNTAIGRALMTADENGSGQLETLLDEWESKI